MRRVPALLITMVLVALASLLTGAQAQAARPPAGSSSAGYVIIAGVPGLRWDDVSPEVTPTLWKLAQRGSIGSLAVRSAHLPTCPADGWVTLGAGNFAERTRVAVVEQCPELHVLIERPDDIGANLPDQPSVVAQQRSLPYGAVPGALAESMRCTTAVGQGAAVAAAKPFGRVDRYAPTLPEQPNTLLSTCVLTIVEVGTVSGPTPEQRAAQAAAADAVLTRLEAARPDGSTLIVAGVSDTDRSGRLHVAVIDGPGWTNGWLTSITTGGRTGYLELVDLAATAVHVLGRPEPKRLFAGNPATRTEGKPEDLQEAKAALADADRRASSSLSTTGWFLTLLAGLQIVLYLAVIPLLRRSYLHAGPTGPTSPPARLVSLLEILLIGAALVLPAAVLADVVPWWRSGPRGGLFAGVTLALTVLLTALVVRLPKARQTLLPLGVVSAIAAGVISLDLVTGARLQLNGVVGYSALQGGRFSGMGIVVMGVFIAGVLMLSGWLAHRVPQHRRTLLVVGVGAVAVVLIGSPSLGADAGGAVALTAGVCLTAALAAGGWLTFTRVAWALLAGVVVTLGFALVDIRRPVDRQGSLGRFLNQLADGTSSLTLHRVGAANVAAFSSSALTVLAIASAVFAWAVLLRPWGGLKRLFGIYPAIRAAAIGMIVATIIAGVLGGVALNVAAAAAATALPLLTVGAMRALEHAADRTRAAESLPADTGEAVSPG
ncbi:hypothetical protein Rhe02_96760 [Rhizocola hellebori]|uniref:Uncharacterized protein n=1 Tax=Rhizocola hellebori TaxID=1392758 RepID=A0A8J3QI94_9ACTN|nr:hypothetical protein [Rhizocola hellebori]GIH11609.1 hypothetical protein Rhe02_96760 [Rhizocola hellebori]